MEKIEGPFQEVRTMRWYISDQNLRSEFPVLDESIQNVLNRLYTKVGLKKESQSKFTVFAGHDYIAYIEYRRKEKASLLSPQSLEKIELSKDEKVTRWDFLSTLTPPKNLSIESGVIYNLEKLG